MKKLLIMGRLRHESVRSIDMLGNFMFYAHDVEGYSAIVEGVKMKTMVYGEKTLMTRFELKKGSLLAFHTHPHEQTGFLLSGEMILTIGEKEFHVKPGDAWAINSNVKHSARVIKDAVAVEVFSPLREAYLPSTN